MKVKGNINKSKLMITNGNEEKKKRTEIIFKADKLEVVST